MIYNNILYSDKLTLRYELVTFVEFQWRTVICLMIVYKI